jgi:hypothetical protein
MATQCCRWEAQATAGQSSTAAFIICNPMLLPFVWQTAALADPLHGDHAIKHSRSDRQRTCAGIGPFVGLRRSLLFFWLYQLFSDNKAIQKASALQQTKTRARWGKPRPLDCSCATARALQTGFGGTGMHHILVDEP